MSFRPRNEEFARLLRTFAEIEKQCPSTVQRRFELNQLAPVFNLPKAEMRKLFELWQSDRHTGNFSSRIEGGES